MKAIKKLQPNDRGNFFIIDGYAVKVIDGKYHCNGLIISTFKQLTFSINYFNKKLKDTK